MASLISLLAFYFKKIKCLLAYSNSIVFIKGIKKAAFKFAAFNF